MIPAKKKKKSEYNFQGLKRYRQIRERGGTHKPRLCLRMVAQGRRFRVLRFDPRARDQKPGSGPLHCGELKQRPSHKAMYGSQGAIPSTQKLVRKTTPLLAKRDILSLALSGGRGAPSPGLNIALPYFAPGGWMCAVQWFRCGPGLAVLRVPGWCECKCSWKKVAFVPDPAASPQFQTGLTWPRSLELQTHEEWGI